MEEILPKHIAVIMDGNRRWAREKGLAPTEGHKEGAKTLKKIVEIVARKGVKALTVYAFSTENWKRSEMEVNLLMELFKKLLKEYSKDALKNDIKVQVIGRREGLSKELLKIIEDLENLTKDCKRMTFNIAINYGGREEIKEACKKLAIKVKNGDINPEDISEDMISNTLYTRGVPDPDLVIRTSGEVRISNFLLWQIAYSEFLFVDKNWPDFNEKDIDYAIYEFSKRNRKFGAK